METWKQKVFDAINDHFSQKFVNDGHKGNGAPVRELLTQCLIRQSGPFQMLAYAMYCSSLKAKVALKSPTIEQKTQRGQWKKANDQSTIYTQKCHIAGHQANINNPNTHSKRRAQYVGKYNPAHLASWYSTNPINLCQWVNYSRQTIQHYGSYGVAVGLKVRFIMKLVTLHVKDWHFILWPSKIVHSTTIVRHLRYLLTWLVSDFQQLDWVEQRLQSNLQYWKLSTWPLYVHRRIV